MVRKLEKITVPILNDEYKVYVLMGDKKEAEKFVSSYHKHDCHIGEWFRGIFFYQSGYHPVIYLNLRKNDDHFWATLAHEATHVVKQIFDEIGEHESNEIFAHSVGAIVYAVEKHLKKKSKRKKK